MLDCRGGRVESIENECSRPERGIVEPGWMNLLVMAGHQVVSRTRSRIHPIRHITLLSSSTSSSVTASKFIERH
jgi:hypothetical protein